MSETNIVVTSGRVRASYRIGELLFETADPNAFRGILHIIGERPGLALRKPPSLPVMSKQINRGS
jgi:ethanolamine ammonia-lyase small subunit